VRKSAAAALLDLGPLGTDEVARLLAQSDQDSSQTTARWRALGWAFNGALPMANDGAILMTFAGHPAAIPIERVPTDPTRAAQVLSVFASYWPNRQEARALQTEIAQQAVAIIRDVCQVTATSPGGGGILETVAERIAQEWFRTVAWLRGWLPGANDLRCWQGTNRAVLTLLGDEFGKVKELGAYKRQLDDFIAEDSATPVFGQSIVAAGGWALIWTAFVAVFPYSTRVRAIYLYNEKMRGFLSLWFLPALMILLSPLRRRMLLPFRGELLADARLSLLKEAEFYPGLRMFRGPGSKRQMDQSGSGVPLKLQEEKEHRFFAQAVQIETGE
jgi:hypothetical protein